MDFGGICLGEKRMVNMKLYNVYFYICNLFGFELKDKYTCVYIIFIKQAKKMSYTDKVLHLPSISM